MNEKKSLLIFLVFLALVAGGIVLLVVVQGLHESGEGDLELGSGRGEAAAPDHGGEGGSAGSHGGGEAGGFAPARENPDRPGGVVEPGGEGDVAVPGGAEEGPVAAPPGVKREGPPLEGEVTDWRARPVAGANITLYAEYGITMGPGFGFNEIVEKVGRPEVAAAETRTDEAGRFRFAAKDVPAGEYCLHAHRTGLALRVVHHVSVPAPKDAKELSVVLEKGGHCAGSVTDETGRRLEGARVVCLGEPPQAAMQSGRLDFDKAWTNTGSEGRFRFDDLPRKGGYILIAQKEGYAVAMKHEVDVPSEDHEIALSRGFSLEGKVTDARSGRPLAGAKVLAIGGRGGSIDQAVSDAEGRYRFANLAPGEYELMFSAEGFSAAHESVGGQIGETQVKDVQLSKGLRIAGKVTARDTGEPVAGAKVVAVGGDESAMFEGVKMVESGEDGSFVLEEVSVSPQFTGNPSEGRQDLVVQVFADKAGWVQATPPQIEVAPGLQTLERIEILMAPAPRVRGRVVDASGGPVAGVTVRAMTPGREDIRMFTGREDEKAVTGEDGRFQLDVVPGDSTILVAGKEGSAPEIKSLEEIGIDRELSGIEIRLVSGGSLAGKVLGPGGEPAPGERVQLTYLGRASEPGSVDPWTFLQIKEFNREIRCDENGAFRLSHLTSGTWRVSAFEGMETQTAKIVDGGGEASVVLQKRPPRPIAGVVVDADGAPVASANLYVYNPETDFSKQTTTSSDGSFRVEGLPPGTFQVYVWSEKGRGHAPEVEAGDIALRIVVE